jgi:hypothetical protein
VPTNIETINLEVLKVSEEPSKKISLTVNHRLLTELYKLVGKRQFISGERITITKLINSILAEYVNAHQLSAEDGYHA